MKELLTRIADEIQAALAATPREDWGRHVRTGTHGASTTLVDDLAESVAFQVLKDAGNPVNILSEESDYVDHGEDHTLVIDPVDGTLNALQGIPLYTVSLAVGTEQLGDVRYGLIRDLARGTTYWTEKGKGAFRDGERLRVNRYRRDASLFDVYLGAEAHEDSYGVARTARRVRNLGAASLDMTLVAQGSADLYYVHTKRPEVALRIVDIAAGTLLVREAGGDVLNLKKARLDMPFDLTARANLIAVGDKAALEAVP